jgi:16S rRNA (adenine1518-N6/adenine1519-N6)-dimethyltransferase
VPPQKLRVCGNLPYNISSPLLFHLLESIGSVADQHFMLQKEVVERMTATPGGKEYGRLSVMLQVHYDMGLLFDVAPESFDPPPRVDSAVVRMVPRKTPLLPPEHQTVFARLVMQAFSQRRKMLRNTLRDYASHLATLDIAPTVRAEDVAVTQYVALAASVYGEQTDR